MAIRPRPKIIDFMFVVISLLCQMVNLAQNLLRKIDEQYRMEFEQFLVSRFLFLPNSFHKRKQIMCCALNWTWDMTDLPLCIFNIFFFYQSVNLCQKLFERIRSICLLASNPHYPGLLFDSIINQALIRDAQPRWLSLWMFPSHFFRFHSNNINLGAVHFLEHATQMPMTINKYSQIHRHRQLMHEKMFSFFFSQEVKTCLHFVWI